MSFKQAVLSTPVDARTTNGMRAQESSLSNCVDLFYKVGASRGRNLNVDFERAYQEDRESALRIAQWARDIRGGAGERQMYRDLLLYLEKFHKDDLLQTRILHNTSEIGRWDDLLIFSDPEVKKVAYGLIAQCLHDGLVATKLLDTIDSMSEDECKALLTSMFGEVS